MISKTIFKNRPWGLYDILYDPLPKHWSYRFYYNGYRFCFFSSSVRTTNHTLNKSALKMILYYG